ncbi:MAG: hypothetical protein V1676_03485 [Candidatus Diapherotrites archaeon]
MRTLNRAGQEAAPFELLVAVIVMTFVIGAGLVAINYLNQEKCKGEADSSVENMKTAIETVAKSQGHASVSFTIPGCFRASTDRGCSYSSDPEGAKLCIRHMDDETVCSHYCGGSSRSCYLLMFSSANYHSVRCLRISSMTNFLADAPCDPAQPGEGWVLENWGSESIREGQYKLLNPFGLDADAPIVCPYRRVSG